MGQHNYFFFGQNNLKTCINNRNYLASFKNPFIWQNKALNQSNMQHIKKSNPFSLNVKSQKKGNQMKTDVYTLVCTSTEIKVILYIYKHTSVPDRLRPKCCRHTHTHVTHITCRLLLHLSFPQFARFQRSSLYSNTQGLRTSIVKLSNI